MSVKILWHLLPVSFAALWGIGLPWLRGEEFNKRASMMRHSVLAVDDNQIANSVSEVWPCDVRAGGSVYASSTVFPFPARLNVLPSCHQLGSDLPPDLRRSCQAD